MGMSGFLNELQHGTLDKYFTRLGITLFMKRVLEQSLLSELCPLLEGST